VVEQASRASVAADEARLFLGTVNGRPATSGHLIRSGDAAGVYTTAVKEAFRRPGIGEAMGWRVLRDDRATGCQVGVL
jgi:ribosomal protein S18 acetylase RimI-like enzyme